MKVMGCYEPAPGDMERAEAFFNENGYEHGTNARLIGMNPGVSRLAALLAQVRAEERERCAKVCDVKAAFNRETAEEYASEGEDMDYRRHTSRAAAFGDAAAAIRGSK